MRLLLSIPFAFLGSLAGSALRSGLQAAEERLSADPDAPPAEMNINVNGSALAAVAGGVTGLLFGARTAFWTGTALGAAGIERFDMRLLKLAGVDIEAMVQRARSMGELRDERAATAPAVTTEIPIDSADATSSGAPSAELA